MQQRQLNTTSVYRRLSLVGLSVGLLVVVLNMWIDATFKGEQVQRNTLSEHIRLMLNHSALMAQRKIQAKDIDGLTLMLDDMTHDPYILQAMIYDNTGKVLAKSHDALSAQALYQKQRVRYQSLPPFDAQAEQSPLDITMYVSEIYHEQQLLGYLHVSYRKQLAMSAPLSFYQENMQKMLLMMLLSGLIGYMLTRGFARFSRNSYRIVDSQ